MTMCALEGKACSSFYTDGNNGRTTTAQQCQAHELTMFVCIVVVVYKRE